MKTKIEVIADELKIQDNRATHLPMYVVRQERIIYGIDPHYDCSDVVYYDQDIPGTIDDPVRISELNEIFKTTYELPENITRVGIKRIWEWVTVFFTNKAAEQYIEENKHNLNNPHVYVASGYRNKEWETIRGYIINNF